MTKYEKAIFEIINASHEHLTVEQVFEKIKPKYPKIVLATVYNNINKLYKNGQIRKLSTEGFMDRYDRMDKHDHLVCKECGKLIDFNFDDLTETLQKKVQNKVLYYDLQVFTLCPDCQKKKTGFIHEKTPLDQN